jgi:uncharacterized membrane protein YdfJ with MMPL/SSD domain
MQSYLRNLFTVFTRIRWPGGVMFEAWGRWLYRTRRLTLGVALLFAIFAGVWGTGVFGQLTGGNTFTPPGSQSNVESSQSAALFGRGDADAVVLFRSASLTVADPAYRQAVAGYLARLPAADFRKTATYWTSHQADLVSADRHSTYAVLQLAGATGQDRNDTYKAIQGDFQARAADGVTAQVGGAVPASVTINSQISKNIARAESISSPVLLILLVFIFGSVVAALAPLLIGALSILGAFTVLRLLTLVTPVSNYSINIVTILGIGLGIDYGLFVVTRFREELRRQPPGMEGAVEAAVTRTVATAGRTVLVSGVTVALALSSLMLFQPVFLRSMGYGGVATVAVDVIAALTVLPALLAVLGHRVNALAVRRTVRDGTLTKPEAEGAWYRLALRVMRRPVAFVVVIVVVLLALGAPFLRIAWGGSDARVLPSTSTVRVVQQDLASEFPANSTSPIEVLVTGPTSPGGLSTYLNRIDAVPGVTGAHVTAQRADAVRLDVGYRPLPDSQEARQIVKSVRALAPPPHAAVLAGGVTAQLVDELSSLGGTLPWMALLTALATFILLFLAFGSVVLPLKAIVLNVLSLSATFGVLVWVFQWGHQGTLRRDRRQHRRRGRGPAAHRRPDHQPGPAAGHRRGLVLRLQRLLPQAPRRRHDRRPDRGRHGGPHPARPGRDAPPRPGELVGPGPAAPPLRPLRHQRV